MRKFIVTYFNYKNNVSTVILQAGNEHHAKIRLYDYIYNKYYFTFSLRHKLKHRFIEAKEFINGSKKL